MATLICPNCGAENVLSIEGVCECEYCGTVVTNTPCNSVNIPQSDTDRSETFLTGILSISEDEAIKIAKDYVIQQLKEVLKDEDEEVYKYFLSPLSKRFGELKFSVKLFYVPAFFFKGEGLENGNIVNYCFSCFAGNDHSYPKCLIDTVNFNTYFNIYYCNGIVFVNNDSINSNTQRLFIKNPKEIWHSVRGRKMRNYLQDHDTPTISFVLLPMFQVIIRLGQVSKDMAISGDGKVWRAASYCEDIFVEHELGKNYQDIIENLKAFDGKELAQEIKKLRNK